MKRLAISFMLTPVVLLTMSISVIDAEKANTDSTVQHGVNLDWLDPGW
ncbi:hypothetical protein [Brevibacillus dissolubilis]|nr:hypothetical protein [Brevibacillus dissolubilis]